MRAPAFACFSVFFSGCTLFPSEPDFPWASKPICADNNVAVECTSKHVADAYKDARVYCLNLAKSYEDGSDLVNSSTFFIGGIGTLAGAVFSPLAGGSAKTAWSGLSGSANALQTGVNTSFSNAVNARRRAEIANAGTAGKDAVVQGTDPTKRVLAAIDLAYDCKMAIGRADVAAAEALNKIQSGAPIKSESPSATVDPVGTKVDAEKSAEEAAKPAADAATKVAIDPSATVKDKATIEKLRGQIAEAAAVAAAPVAAAAATDVARKASVVGGETPSLNQTQAAATVAAQMAAEPVARAAAEEKAAEILTGKSQEVKNAVLETTVPAASAAAEAAAKAAASTATAPAQPVITP
jgi:hypothetical protein